MSCLHLSLDNPLNNPDGEMAYWLKYVDYITTVVFLFECIIKIIGFGFMMNGAKSYIRDSWN
jgi:hypothetical protein